jgi:hypothetical protein
MGKLGRNSMKQVNYLYDRMLDVFIVFFAGLLVFMGCATVYEAVTPLQFMDQEVGMQTLAILEEGTLETVPCEFHKIPPYFHVQGCTCGFLGPNGEWLCQ